MNSKPLKVFVELPNGQVVQGFVTNLTIEQSVGTGSKITLEARLLDETHTMELWHSTKEAPPPLEPKQCRLIRRNSKEPW